MGETPIHRLQTALRNRLTSEPRLAATVGDVARPAHPGGWPALWLTLPSGARARVEDIDGWGVIVEDADANPRRGDTFTGTGGDPLTGTDHLDQVVAATEAAVRALVDLDTRDQLDRYGTALT